DALQKALTLTPETARQFQAWKRTLDQMETLLGLAPRLADIVKWELRSEDFQKGLLFGKLCSVKKHYQAACRLHDQALTSDPEAAKKMAPFNLLFFARASLLAAAGTGSDPPPEAESPKYRAKALAWLRSYVKAQQGALEKNASANRYSCQQNLRVLLQH